MVRRNVILTAAVALLAVFSVAPVTGVASATTPDYPPATTPDYPPASTVPSAGQSPTPPPTTTPPAGLPATGSNGLGTTTTVATILALLGVGLIVVSQARKRSSVR
jgi:hypothetical protein